MEDVTGMAELVDTRVSVNTDGSAEVGWLQPPATVDEPSQVVIDRRLVPAKSTVREVFEFVVVTVIVALFGMTFFVQGMKVPTGSMQNTIEIGDHLLVNKFIDWGSSKIPFIPARPIRRGDVIVFKYPGNKYDHWKDVERDISPFSINYVKRVIGMPGDVIEISGTQIKVNGHPLEERVVYARDPCDVTPQSKHCQNATLTPVSVAPGSKSGAYSVFYEPGPMQSSDSFPVFQNEGNAGKITVPADSYFVMGDNRDNSEDSRYWGFVHKDLVVGRAMLVYWSYDDSAESRGNGIFDFFINSRWRRSGTMLK
jgi:signal peptidase I